MTGKPNSLSRNDTYSKVFTVSFNEIGKPIQQDPSLRCIHCSPWAAKFEGLTGCLYGNVNIGLKTYKQMKVVALFNLGMIL